MHVCALYYNVKKQFILFMNYMQLADEIFKTKKVKIFENHKFYKIIKHLAKSNI